MLNTTIDINVLFDFFRKQPQRIPIGSEEENKLWNSFWNYLKKDTNLTITNFEDVDPMDPVSIYLTSLTSGRGSTSECKTESNFKKPNKYKFPKRTKISSVFFLNEPDTDVQKKYRESNGFIFGFINDYFNIWERLCFFNKPKLLPVRDNIDPNFRNWDQLKDYLNPITDAILCDNYILQEEGLFEANLFKILKLLSESTSVRFNLLIVSYEGGKYKIDIERSFNSIKEFCLMSNISCNLGIVLATSELKEHDRGIFLNFSRFSSQDSFVYFLSNGDYATKGTTIRFDSYVEIDKANDSEAALTKIKTIVDKINRDYRGNIRGCADNFLISDDIK